MTPLRLAREAAGYKTRPAAVAAFIRLAGHRRVKLTATRESITRMMRGWENGDHEAKEPYLGLLCQLYGRSSAELGLSEGSAQARSDIGLIYSPSLDEAVATISSLAMLDGQRHPGVVSWSFSEHAANAACLDWVFGYPKWDLVSGRNQVTAHDVAEVVATTVIFDCMDRQRAGEHIRRLAVTYLRDNVLPRLRSSYDDHVGADLFHAAAVLCELIGYMAYDEEKHSLAQRYFIQALRLARSAGDTAYGAFVLNTMSHQAIYLRRPKEALRLAQASRQTYQGIVPVVSAEAAMLEARACAELGDTLGCGRAISAAEASFAAHDSAEFPPWASHWSETLFNAFAGDCWLNLGDARHARPHLVGAWEGSQTQARRKVFAAGQLAKVALLERKVEEACYYALIATESVNDAWSRRSRQVVSTLRTDLSTHNASAMVRVFVDRADHVLAG